MEEGDRRTRALVEDEEAPARDVEMGRGHGVSLFAPGGVNGLTVRPAAESSMSVCNRRSRVSGLTALVTQYSAARRYEAGACSNHDQAVPLARNRASAASSSFAVARS